MTEKQDGVVAESGERVEKEMKREKIPEVKVSQEEWDKVKEKSLKSDEYFDRFLRVSAEFDNYRKRMNREREEFAKYAAEGLICEFLAVVDNLEGAILSSNGTNDFAALRQGVEMTKKEALRILNRWGVEEVKTVGEKFDPEKHEAIMHIDCDEEEGKIVEELRKGYSLKGKLIRPAMVKVTRRSNNEQGNRD